MILNYKINKPANFIFDYLTNMTRFASVHPVISKMEYLGENKYLVFETLKWGLIPCSFAYPVTIEIHYEKKQIVMRAIVMKSIKIKMVFNIKDCNGYSIIKEEINFKTALPIQSVMRQVFKKQHTRLFKNIENISYD